MGGAALVPVFLTALADEADDTLDLLFTLERVWLAALAVSPDGGGIRNFGATRPRDKRCLVLEPGRCR